ncbi:hypothetical protein [Halobacterium bonnevillei]|uniref:Uncharacterized protein n=1 Tax=Halobacterium bonnevillei TaxID=2692200 RepID=A0A6B0SHS1_9EURY|nr:hypothetical protein [Halobacterium bonnevillei]MXR20096.1 hypothetical protein [Halobacterium bonnevillei]
MTSADNTSDARTGLLSKLRRIDCTISRWGYGVSGWAGVFIGAVSALLADDLAAWLSLSATPLPDTLTEPLVLLVLVYGLLGVAYEYRQRYGGPSCRV